MRRNAWMVAGVAFLGLCTGRIRADDRGLHSVQEATLPVFNLPWPRGLAPEQFEHVVLASRETAFACASRLEELSEAQAKAKRDVKRMSLSSAILGAATTATSGSLQLIPDDHSTARTRATAITGVVGGLATAILSAIALFKNGNTVQANSGKRIGEIQSAIKTFVEEWTFLIQTGAESPDGGLLEGDAGLLDHDASLGCDTGELIAVEPDISDAGTVIWRWCRKDPEAYFEHYGVFDPQRAIVASNRRTDTYLKLVEEVNKLASVCVARVDLEPESTR